MIRRLSCSCSILALAGVAACLFAGLARAELVDAVLATVDKEVVLYSELRAQIGSEIDKIRGSAASAEEKQRAVDQLVSQALEESVNFRLLVREAKKTPNLDVSDKELDIYVEEDRKRFDNSEDFVSAVGSVSEYRERLRQQILKQRISMIKREGFESQVVVSEDEITSYYQEHQAKFKKSERIYLRQIFLKVQGGDTERAQARAKLESLRAEIAAGTAFIDLARQHSQGPEAAEGGAVGWQQRGDLIEALEGAAFALPAGGLSDVVDSQFGVHLLKVDQHEQAGTATISEVRLEIEKELRQTTANKKFDTWLSDLRKRSRVRIFL